MNVLLVGGGGREHALAWKIAQSPDLDDFYCAPGNPGISALATCVAIADTDIDALVEFATDKRIDLVVIGPEAPLAAGLANRLARAGIAAFGPSQEAAQIETSKAFMKDLCARHNIPTAAYKRCETAPEAKAFLDDLSAPYVIKADGLAAGKGVVIAQTRGDAETAIDDMFSGKFGDAGAVVVVEEFLEGQEASFFVLTDGEAALPLIASQDHKRAFDGDKGPNTGGMGVYTPAPVFTDEVEQAVMERIIIPTLDALAEDGAPYRGVLYAGLMIGPDGPKLIEYNARFGDPECQVMMRLLLSDLLPALYACARGGLDGIDLAWSDHAAANIVMATKGYPEAYEKGSEIRGVEDAGEADDVVIFHAGTAEKDGALVANGGRVLNITTTDESLKGALDRAYAAIEKIDWPEGFYRKDIGWRAL